MSYAIKIVNGETVFRPLPDHSYVLEPDELLTPELPIGITVDGGRIRGLNPAERLAKRKLLEIDELKRTTKEKIEGGFVSSALGAPHTYETRLPQDQINLLGAALKAKSTKFTCIDANGVKSRKVHTASQMKKVSDDGADYMSACLDEYEVALQAIINQTV